MKKSNRDIPHEHAMELLQGVVRHTEAGRRCLETIEELMDMGFTESDLLFFGFPQGDIREALSEEDRLAALDEARSGHKEAKAPPSHGQAFDKGKAYPVAMVGGHPFLFVNARVDRATVPEGMFAYDVGDGGCDGCFTKARDFVLVNHWGTIIGREPLPMADDGVYRPRFGSAEYEGDYVGEAAYDEYMAADFEDGGSMAVLDGEYAVFRGRRYLLGFSFVPDGDGAGEARLRFYKKAKEALAETVGASSTEAVGLVQTALAGGYGFEITPSLDVRVMELRDAILQAAEGAGVSVSVDARAEPLTKASD